METKKAELIPLITAALREWHEVNSSENLRQQIFQRLNNSRDEILLKLLGFNKDTWKGAWQLDHCNGRSGNSIAGDYLKQVQQQAINDWLKDNCTPKLTEAQKKQLETSFRAEFFNHLKDEMRTAAKFKAKQVASELVEKIVPIEDIEAHLKTLNLLLPE